MDNPVIYQALGGLLVLFFLFLIYMFTKTWRWFHVVCMFFVFGASIALCYFTPAVYKTLAAWRSVALKNRLAAEKLEQEYRDLQYGDLTQVVQTTPSLRKQNARFARLVFDRGRVWRQCTHQPPQGGSVVVSTVPPGVAAGDASPNQIIEKMVLYAFGEIDAYPELGLPVGSKLPFFFIGEFSATAVSDTSVTLTPTLPLDPMQVAAIGVYPTWTLFETMPIDGHPFFATDPNKLPDLNKFADEAPVFGNMDPDFLSKLIPVPPQPPPQFISPEIYQKVVASHPAVLDNYLRDGKRAADTDLPDNTWVKVRFLKEHEVLVDSDATLGGVEGSQDFFDRGRTEIPLLQRGEPAKFKKGDVGVFPQGDADNLITQGICERIEPIYVRPLNDYEYEFRTVHFRMVAIQQETERINRNLAELNEADARIVTQISYRQQERDKLQADLAKFQYEAKQIGEYRDKLQRIADGLKADLSRLYRTNYQLEQEMARIDSELTDEINRRTREAVSAVEQ